MRRLADGFKKAAKGVFNDSDDEKHQPQQQQYQQQQAYHQQTTYQQPQHNYQQQQVYQQQQSDEEHENQQQQAYRQQQSDDDDDNPQQATRGHNFQQEDDDDEDQQYQGQQAQYGAEDDDDENDGNTGQMQRQTLNDDSDEDNTGRGQESDNEEDYQGNTRSRQQAQDDEDENGVDQDAEDLAAPDDDDEDVHHSQQPVVNQTINIVVKEDRPTTQNAPNSELAQAGMLLVKQMLAQQTNSFGGHKGKLLTHQDVQHEVVDEHEDQDWRIMMLTTSNHRGQVFQLEAKMDTGADLNFMNAAAARGHQIDYDIMEGPEMPSATVGSGGHVSPDGIATVKYTAGVHQKTYTEDFYISEGVPHDVILGKPFLEHAHAITLNPEFAKPAHKPDFLLFELSPMDEKKAKEAEEFRKQKQAEREARRNVRVKK